MNRKITRRNMTKNALKCALAGSLGAVCSQNVLAAGENILLLSVQPISVGFGTTNTYALKLVDSRGRGIAGKRMRVWFSGQHAIQTGSWVQSTNANGDVAFILTTPRSWQGKTGWIDLNATVADGGIAVQKLFKIKK